MKAPLFLLPPMPITSMTPTHYRLEIPLAGMKWLTANGRLHRMAQANIIRQWRAAARWAAIQAEVPMLWRTYIVAELRFALTRKGKQDHRRRDPANWGPTAKACVDGLVDAKILVDDSQDYVIGPDMRIGVGQESPAIVLHLWRHE